jgi:hypothetical protein
LERAAKFRVYFTAKNKKKTKQKIIKLTEERTKQQRKKSTFCFFGVDKTFSLET